MKISETIKYIGVNDYNVDLFEGQYKVPNGMSYNSYVIFDEKIAVMDTVDQNFTEEWMEKLQEALQGSTPDFLIIQHMEPDHSANIAEFMKKYPEALVLASAPAFTMMRNLFGVDYKGRGVVIKEGDMISLGKHKLYFMAAPMVHWPEVMVTYDAYDKVLFSADGFGKFGAVEAKDYAEASEIKNWAEEARRYYIGICGKFGMQVQNLLKKVGNLDVQTICPLHGPVLTGDLGEYIRLYDIWSSYGVESEGVVIAYTSVYGNTQKAVEVLADMLYEKGCPKVVVHDLARGDMSEAVADAFCYGKLVLATTTYNADIFPKMKTFIRELIDHNFQNRQVALVENGMWAPAAARVMRSMLEGIKDLRFADTSVRITASVNEASMAQLEALAKELCE